MQSKVTVRDRGDMKQGHYKQNRMAVRQWARISNVHTKVREKWSTVSKVRVLSNKRSCLFFLFLGQK
jgi:hypothetical protein